MPVTIKAAALAFGNELRRPTPSAASDRFGTLGLGKDTALGVDPFFEPVGREAAQLPKAGGVGDERTNRRRRLSETTFVAVAIDCSHSIASRSWQ